MVPEEEGLYRPTAGELQPELGAETFYSEILGTLWGRLLAPRGAAPVGRGTGRLVSASGRSRSGLSPANSSCRPRGTGPRGIGAGSGQTTGTAERALRGGRVLTDPRSDWDVGLLGGSSPGLLSHHPPRAAAQAFPWWRNNRWRAQSPQPCGLHPRRRPGPDHRVSPQ